MFMRSRFALVCLLLGFWFVTSVAPAVAGSAEDEVAAANSAFYEAFSRQDAAAMAAAWSGGPAVRMIGPRASAIVEGSEAVRGGWQRVFDMFSEVSISMANPHIRAGSQAAWVVGLETVEGIRGNGDEFQATVLATNVFEKRDGKWVMVHHHASLPAE